MMGYGFYLDIKKCIGCHTCQAACKDRNDLEAGVNFRQIHSYQTGSYPDARIYHLSIACNHCREPECVRVCPAGAMYQSDDGTVQHDAELCIGCRSCIKNCPYRAPAYLEKEGRIGKCDSCADLREKGQEPACVGACVMRCLEFDEISKLTARHPDSADCSIPALPDPDTTKPCLLLGLKECALRKDFREVLL